MAKKRKISKASKRRLVVFGTISLVVIFYFLFSLSYHSYKIYTLKNEEKKLSQKLLELQKEERILSNDMEKLKDPEYLAKYAREAYSYSKEDEIIIQKYIEEEKQTEKNKNNFNLEDKYIFVICVGVLVLIMFYILIKAMRHNKKGK